jgi:hypothetical protein
MFDEWRQEPKKVIFTSAIVPPCKPTYSLYLGLADDDEDEGEEV